MFKTVIKKNKFNFKSNVFLRFEKRCKTGICMVLRKINIKKWNLLWKSMKNCWKIWRTWKTVSFLLLCCEFHFITLKNLLNYQMFNHSNHSKFSFPIFIPKQPPSDHQTIQHCESFFDFSSLFMSLMQHLIGAKRRRGMSRCWNFPFADWGWVAVCERIITMWGIDKFSQPAFFLITFSEHLYSQPLRHERFSALKNVRKKRNYFALHLFLCVYA